MGTTLFIFMWKTSMNIFKWEVKAKLLADYWQELTFRGQDKTPPSSFEFLLEIVLLPKSQWTGLGKGKDMLVSSKVDL